MKEEIFVGEGKPIEAAPNVIRLLQYPSASHVLSLPIKVSDTRACTLMHSVPQLNSPIWALVSKDATGDGEATDICWYEFGDVDQIEIRI